MIKPLKSIYVKPQCTIRECKILPKSATDKTPELVIFSPKENISLMYSLMSNRVVGKAYFVLRNTFIEIAELFINKGERGKGYGKKFLDYIQEISRANGRNGNMKVYAALVKNEEIPPHLFYAKYGFRATDRRAQKKIDEALANDSFDLKNLRLNYEPMVFNPK